MARTFLRHIRVDSIDELKVRILKGVEESLLNEWAYARPYRSNGDRLHALRRFVDFYNHGRPHTAIDGLVPRAAVNNVPEHLGAGADIHTIVRPRVA